MAHIFKLGTKYSEDLDALYTDEAGERKPMVMGCYGIGVSRSMAAIVEEHHDEKGIIWPREVAPFDIVILLLDPVDEYGFVREWKAVYGVTPGKHRAYALQWFTLAVVLLMIYIGVNSKRISDES